MPRIVGRYEQLGDVGWCFWPNGARHSKLQLNNAGLDQRGRR
jgi:hypothetical protein